MDWNGDGKKDLLAGDTNGAIWFFENKASEGAPQLAEGVKIKSKGREIVGGRTIYEQVDGQYKVKEKIPGNPALAQKYSKLHVADWDGDGKLDILVGYSNPEIIVYLNEGTPGAPAFGAGIVIKPEEGAFPSRPSPFVIDWDKDGKKDLLVGSEAGEIHFYPNISGGDRPRYGAGRQLEAGGEAIKKGSRARIDVADWNGDGKLDILLGDFFSDRTRKADERPAMGGHVWFFPGL